jgi:hypothetical protein
VPVLSCASSFSPATSEKYRFAFAVSVYPYLSPAPRADRKRRRRIIYRQKDGSHGLLNVTHTNKNLAHLNDSVMILVQLAGFGKLIVDVGCMIRIVVFDRLISDVVLQVAKYNNSIPAVDMILERDSKVLMIKIPF